MGTDEVKENLLETWPLCRVSRKGQDILGRIVRKELNYKHHGIQPLSWRTVENAVNGRVGPVCGKF